MLRLIAGGMPLPAGAHVSHTSRQLGLGPHPAAFSPGPPGAVPEEPHEAWWLLSLSPLACSAAGRGHREPTLFFFTFFPSTTLQKGTASPGTPQRAPHGSAQPQHAPTLLGLPKGSSSARRPAPEPGWQPPFLPVMLPAPGGPGPFPRAGNVAGLCRQRVPAKRARERSQRFQHPELAAGLRLLSLLPTPCAGRSDLSANVCG